MYDWAGTAERENKLVTIRLRTRRIAALLLSVILVLGCYSVPMGRVEYIELSSGPPPNAGDYPDSTKEMCDALWQQNARIVLNPALDEFQRTNLGAIGVKNFSILVSPSAAYGCGKFLGEPVFGDYK